MVVLSDPIWIQGAFNALVAIFDRVGLLTNVGKTVSMVCHPCRAGAGNRTEEEYGRKLTGGGEVLRGETMGEGGMRGVWGGSRGRVHVESSDDSTRTSSSTAATVDPPGGRGGQDIQDVLPSEGGTAAMSIGVVP